MSRQSIESLVAELDCDEMIRCQNARRALVSRKNEAVPALVVALQNKKPWVRWEAAKALAQIGDPSATAPLIDALGDKAFDVRWLAAEGLIHLGRKAVSPLLKALIGNPGSVWLREGAHHVLHDMYRGNWDTALKPVMKALEGAHPSVEVPLAASKAIGIIGTKGETR